jgi:hypothetical protein
VAREEEETPVDQLHLPARQAQGEARPYPPATLFFLQFRGPILGCGGSANWALWEGDTICPFCVLCISSKLLLGRAKRVIVPVGLLQDIGG